MPDFPCHCHPSEPPRPTQAYPTIDFRPQTQYPNKMRVYTIALLCANGSATPATGNRRCAAGKSRALMPSSYRTRAQIKKAFIARELLPCTTWPLCVHLMQWKIESRTWFSLSSLRHEQIARLLSPRVTIQRKMQCGRCHEACWKLIGF